MTRASPAPQLAAVALGSNLGDRAGTLRTAIAELGKLGRLVRASQLYETPPLGPPQPPYLNAAALVETTLEAEDFLAQLHRIEAAHGRVRRERWGPRHLDLDLIALGPLQRHDEAPLLPHPEAHRRAFVLVPLAEIAPDLILPGLGTIASLMAALPTAAVETVKPLAGEDD